MVATNGKAADLWVEREAPIKPYGSPGGSENLLQIREKSFATGDGGFITGLMVNRRHAGPEDMTSPYAEGGWAHAALKTRASAVRQCPLVFYKTDPKKDANAVEVGPDHPLTKLFKRPNRVMSMAQFLEAGELHRRLDGEDFWFLMNGTGNQLTAEVAGDGIIDYPTQIFPVRGRSVEMKPDDNGLPAAWKYATAKTSKGGKSYKEFANGSVIHFRDYHPDNPMRGLGDVEVAGRLLGLEFSAQRYLEAMMRNSGDPGGVILLDHEVAPEEEERLEAEANEKYSLPNAGRWRVVTGKGAKYEQAKYGPRDMQFQELLAFTRDQQLSIYGVPKAVLGVLEDATYSNYQTAVAQFYEGGNGIFAYFASVEDTVNNHFLPRLKDVNARRLVARFDTSMVDALDENMAEKIALALKVSQGGVGVSFNEAAGLVGVNGVDMNDGDVAYMNSNLVPVADVKSGKARPNQGSNSDTPPDQPGGGGDEPDKSALQTLGVVGKSGSGCAEKVLETSTAASASTNKGELGEGERRSYWTTYEKTYLADSERGVKAEALNFLKAYDYAEGRRLSAVLKSNGKRELDDQEIVTIGVILASPELLRDLLLDELFWAEKLRSRLISPLETAFEAGSESLVGEIGGQVITGLDSEAEAFIIAQARTAGIRVSRTLRGLVTRAILRVLRSKDPDTRGTVLSIARSLEPEIRKEIRIALRSKSARATAIGRTEAGRAANTARFIHMLRTGVKRHQWVTSGDEFVRESPPNSHSHVELDGVVREIGTPFHENLKYPQDPDGLPGDVINCRCAAAPITE